jgi:hypothetical protein
MRIPFEVLEPTFERLVSSGYAQRDGERLWLTPAGAQQVDYVYSLLLGWIVDKLSRSPSYQGRPDRREVETALQHIAHRVLAQRDWHDDAPRTGRLEAGVGDRR